MYKERFYRELHKSKDLMTYQVVIEESDLMISSDQVKTEEIKAILEKYRIIVQNACQVYSEFGKSLEPIELISDEPIIRQMISASKKAKVGPMAAIAGTISEYVGREAIDKGIVSQIIVENGGDIFISSDLDRKILIYAGNSPFSNKIGIIIKKEFMPIGVCTSAGTIGHSLSFGKADAVVVISKDTSLADAMATSIGNIVKTKEDIQIGIDFGSQVEGILGILIIVGDQLGVWGNIELFGEDRRKEE